MLNMKARVRKVPVTAELCAFVHREQGESQGGFQRQFPFQAELKPQALKSLVYFISKGSVS